MAATVTVVDTTIPTRSTASSKLEPGQSLQLISDPPVDLPPPTKIATPQQQELEQQIQSTKSNVFVDAICRIILHLIHIIYLTFIIYKTVRTMALDLYHQHLVHSTDTEELIRFDKAQLTKIPKHFSILISNELSHERTIQEWDNIVDDLCRVSCWAWEFGIEELSIFDASGDLKELGIDVYKRQSTMLHQWMSNKEKRGLKFSIVSAEDGRSSVSRAAQNIAKQKIPSEKIDIALVDKFVHECSDISDPELMVVYDALPHSYISLDGFPPWHIRLTEFINKGTHHRLDYMTFSSTLLQYSKVEQRFGR
ncbi:Decaprenyl diphosphate synthase-like protein [Phascolomyces articulosus]|uniref:ditrans,polycis-polyprenyl diphosphate synthase [(2E,6E)-farnesyldiphosphate specific] n=1 Tax=Phascolomyces articulosus TaxID=60185 RepID=A0AAD5KBL0_9FUNG|nr:Decaprenyl diphosphate synthase-like protein [Phascolomyces articulosus]